jgi:hypothetical protein
VPSSSKSSSIRRGNSEILIRTEGNANERGQEEEHY